MRITQKKLWRKKQSVIDVYKRQHNICAEYFAGNVEKSRELQIKYLELIHSLFCEVNPIPVKKALELMGFYGGNVRLPLTQLEPAHTERLKKAMIDTGILK